MQGMILTSDVAARQLKEMNRDYNNKLTWQTALNEVDASAAQAQQKLQQSYTDASAQAYASYLQNRAALANSGYIGAGADSLGNEMNSELTQMYEQYLSTRSDQSQAIETARQEQQDTIYDMLKEQGEYTAKYDKAHYDYLNWLYENKPEYFAEGGIFEDMLYVSDDPDDPTRLKTIDELFAPSTNEAGEQTGLYQPLYDENGNPTGEFELTLKGVDWYDRIENQLNTLQGDKDYKDAGNYTFGEYLSQTDEDLLKWAESYNPYNYTEAGTNAGTFKTMYGMASTDTSYAFAERFAGMTKSELDAGFKELRESISDAGVLDPTKYVDTVYKLVKDFGLLDEFEAEGLTKEKLKKQLNEIKSDAIGNTPDKTPQNMLLGAGGGALAGFVIGGPIGAAIGGLGGMLIGGLGGAYETASDWEKYNPLIQKEYDKLVTQLTQMAMNKRRQDEINFNTGNYR